MTTTLRRQSGTDAALQCVGVVDELHVGLVADDEDAAVGELAARCARRARASTGAPVGLLGLQSTTARVRGVTRGAMSSQRQAVGSLIGERRFDGDGADARTCMW